ncbi:MAG: hypothetical protein N7Q72_06220, partial [Spiroplasma sp. Tabriz.8]|nr:hypothetical protein [Spiroplasma sp. Tabriz.8]
KSFSVSIIKKKKEKKTYNDIINIILFEKICTILYLNIYIYIYIIKLWDSNILVTIKNNCLCDLLITSYKKL